MDHRVDEVEVRLAGKPVVGLYLFLRKHEEELDTNTLGVLNTLERELFHHLSIDEMEGLEQSYSRWPGNA
ncbi:MAG: hypothetical protein GVY14_01105 [Spirochaetes bacterium]|jgi:hypothetical protein|nr:hypothetical protein [Spirochaetota bacterium]